MAPQMQEGPMVPRKKLKRFGWPTVIFTAVVALGLGGFIGGAGGSTTAVPRPRRR
jgi:hypothetical protein